MIANAIRYFYTSEWLSSDDWTSMFMVQPCSVILPFLPLVLPAAWLFLNAFGVSWILALFYTARQYKVNSIRSFYRFHFPNWTTHVLKVTNDPFEETDVTSATTASSFWVKCKDVKPFIFDTLLGRGKSPFRTENVLLTLSSVTVTWPLPPPPPPPPPFHELRNSSCDLFIAIVGFMLCG